MSRIYYRGAKAAIVCYDVMNEKSWEKVQFWVDELKRFEESCRIYIVGNKTDLAVRNQEILLNIAFRHLDIINGIICSVAYI